MQLRICKDCRYNVLAQYKLALSAGRKSTGHTRGFVDEDSSTAASGGSGVGIEAAPGTADSSSHGHSPVESSGSLTADGDAPAAVMSKALAVIPAQPLLPVCEGFSLRVTDATVELVGTDAAMLLEEAEEIEDLKVCCACACLFLTCISHHVQVCACSLDMQHARLLVVIWHGLVVWCVLAGAQGDEGGEVRHAETPELAQEALIDAVILIFKAQVSAGCIATMSNIAAVVKGHASLMPCCGHWHAGVVLLWQVEVAFREQTAGHNALLLLVALSHELLEERLRNAYLDVHARAAEVRKRQLSVSPERSMLCALSIALLPVATPQHLVEWSAAMMLLAAVCQLCTPSL
jgi:hypothetical protein